MSVPAAGPGAALSSAAWSLRVLVVIELGANWGHLLRVLPVIDELRARGHQPLLAAADVASAVRIVGDSQIEVLRTPGAAVHRKGGTAINMATYAQILDRCVFGDEHELAELVSQWDALLEAHRPDVILADFAPGALYVAHLRRLPLLSVNIGWEVPPFDGTLPILRRWLKIDMDKLRAFESALVSRLNRHCMQCGVAPYANLGEIYSVGTRLICTLPETDHFGERREMNYIGPQVTADRGASVRWETAKDSSKRKRVFLYLSRDGRNVVILDALARLNVEVIAVLPGIRKEVVGRFARANIQICDGPVQLASLLPEADLIINNGGHGLIAAGLLQGVPLLIQPIVVEQGMLAKRLEEGGLARVLIDGPAMRHADSQISSALEDNAIHDAARSVAKKYARHAQLHTSQTIADAVERAAARPFAAPRR